MCPLTGRALTSAQLKCQHAAFCSVWQEPCSGCPPMTLKHLLLSGKWICLSVALSSFFFFSNWINWSNRRLSYPSCHAFYLSLIALSFPGSLLYFQTIFVLVVSFSLFFHPLCQSFTQIISNFIAFPLFIFLLSGPCLLMTDCSFCRGNCAFHTLVFKRGAYLTALILLFQLHAK